MAKIPFDVKWKPQIESGEYKLETKDGKQVRVVCWDVKNSYSKVHDDILALVKSKGGTENALFYAQNGYCLSDSSRVGRKDLFIVTPEEEMTEFEKKLWEVLKSEGSPIVPIEKFTNADKEAFHSYAAELLELAKKELCESGEVTDWYAKGKAEALRTRATEFTKNLAKSGLDKDSIQYHLIEFMCNLYDCQNWKEIEDTAELYVTRIKAAALKDLPRWKKKGEDGLFGYYCSCGFLVSDGYEISINELKRKLPRVEEE